MSGWHLWPLRDFLHQGVLVHSKEHPFAAEFLTPTEAKLRGNTNRRTTPALEGATVAKHHAVAPAFTDDCPIHKSLSNR